MRNVSTVFLVESDVQAPPENAARTVWMYRSIDAAAMKADFFAALEGYFKE